MSLKTMRPKKTKFWGLISCEKIRVSPLFIIRVRLILNETDTKAGRSQALKIGFAYF